MKRAAIRSLTLLAGQLAHVSSALSSEAENQLAPRHQLQLSDQLKGHSLVVSNQLPLLWLSTILPGSPGTSLDFDGQNWSSQLLVDESQAPWLGQCRALASGLTGAAVCSGLPLEWQASQELAKKLAPAEVQLDAASLTSFRNHHWPSAGMKSHD